MVEEPPCALAGGWCWGTILREPDMRVSVILHGAYGETVSMIAGSLPELAMRARHYAEGGNDRWTT